MPPFAVPERRRRPQHGAPCRAVEKCGAVLLECRFDVPRRCFVFAIACGTTLGAVPSPLVGKGVAASAVGVRWAQAGCFCEPRFGLGDIMECLEDSCFGVGDIMEYLQDSCFSVGDIMECLQDSCFSVGDIMECLKESRFGVGDIMGCLQDSRFSAGDTMECLEDSCFSAGDIMECLGDIFVQGRDGNKKATPHAIESGQERVVSG